MTPRVCIFGDTDCARQTARQLLAAGLGVILASRRPSSETPHLSAVAEAEPHLEILTEAALRGCRGAAGAFTLSLTAGTEILTRTVSAMVLAESDERRPLHAAYGLSPSPAVVALSAFKDTEAIPRTAAPEGPQVVFLNGLAAESHPLIAAETLRAALSLQKERGISTAVLTGNLKVAADGIEALSREARAAGVLFFKFAATRPAIRQEPDGRARLSFVDEVTGDPCRLQPERIVVDEQVVPSAAARDLARLLDIEIDGSGFLQADNVHRLPVATNRRGIVAAGPARSIGADSAVEAANAVLTALSALAPAPEDRAVIDPGRCIRCLTCVRVCPYQAVLLDIRPAVVAAACERCGICAAECPRGAIHIPGLDAHALLPETEPATPVAPRLTAFCCSRSAALAVQAAAGLDRKGLSVVAVPCAGSLSPEMLLAPFRRGAEGVLVMTCHPDNCHSREGRGVAERRVEQTADFLSRIGMGAGRIRLTSLAANMAGEFTQTVAAFRRTLISLREGAQRRPST